MKVKELIDMLEPYKDRDIASSAIIEENGDRDCISEVSGVKICNDGPPHYVLIDFLWEEEE